MAEENKRFTIDEEISELLLKRAVDDYVEEECAGLVEKYGGEEFEPSLRHRHEMEKIFRSVEKKDKNTHKILKRAAIFVVAFILCGTAAMQVEAVRNSVINFCYDITDKSMDINTSNNDIEIPEGWDYIYMPGYIPEGYGLYDSDLIAGDSYEIVYVSKNKKKIVLQQSKKMDTGWSIDAEEIDKESILIDGKKAFLMNKGNHIIVWWYNGDYYMYVISEENREETIKISESFVKKSKK